MSIKGKQMLQIAFFMQLLSINASIAQIVEKSGSIIKSSNCNGTESIDLLAGREVVFKDGFQFQASTQSTLTAKIDESLYKNPNYQVQTTDPNSSDYPDNRALDKSLTIGSIPGEINIGATGAAEYSMPIDLPSAVSGLVPELSIIYNGAGGNSILGHCFNLSGISKISLVSKDFYFDGRYQVANQADGPYSLDGQRLLTSNGVDYMTEVENYSKITKAGTNPESSFFTVNDTKSRRTYEYGRTNNAKGSLETGVYCWNIDQTKDQFGNAINYYYKAKPGIINGSHVDEYGSAIDEPAKTVDENVLDKITYGINGENEIDFFYSLRDDDFHVKALDAQVGISTLVDHITIKSQGQIISIYEFKYIKNSFGASCLAEVVKRNGSQEKINSTLFRWNDPNSFQFSQKTLPITIPTFNSATDFKGDFNNDGITDLLIKSTGSDYYLYTFDSQAIPTLTTLTLPHGELVCAGDYDGDRRTELLGYYNNKCVVWTINSSSLFYPIMTNDIETNKPHSVSSDFNQNGKSDIYISTFYPDGSFMQEDLVMYEMTPQNGKLEIVQYLKVHELTNSNDPISSIHIGDIDNNGFTDILLNGHQIGHNTATGSINWSRSSANGYDCSSFGIFDVNNDGHDELLTHNPILCPDPIYDFNGDGDYKDSYVFTYSRTFVTGSPGSENTINPISSEPQISNLTDFLTCVPFVEGEVISTVPYNNGSTIVVTYRRVIDESEPDIKCGEEYNGMTLDDTHSCQTDVNGDGIPEYLVSGEFVINGYSSHFLFKTQPRSGQDVNISPIAPIDAVVGDFNGDGATDFVNGNILYYCPNPKIASVAAIIDGNNNKIEITYDRIVDKDRVQPAYPFAQIAGPFNVVSSIKKTVGSDEFTTSYVYSDSRFHIGGKGFLGFENTVQTTEFTEVTTKQEFNTSHFFPSKTTTTVKNKYNNLLYTLSITESTIDVVSKTEYNRYAVSKTTTVQSDFDGNNTKQIKTYDTEYGYLKSESTSKYREDEDPITKVETAYSGHDSNDYKQPTLITITYNRKSLTPISTSSTYSYWPNGLLHVTTKNGLTKTFTYDDWGNMLTAITSGTDLLEPQTDTYIYDDLQLNAETYTNSCGQSVTKKFDCWGNVTEETDLRSKTTYHTYDDWGNLLSTQTPDGFTYTYKKTWADGDAPTDAYYYTALFKNGVLEKKDYFDRKGQNIRSVSIGYNGIQLYADKTYDTRGNLTSISEPYPSTGVADIITTYAYDDDRGFGRMSSETNPRLTKVFSYNINTATTTITKDNVTEEFFKEYDASGFMIKARDNGGEIVYVPDVDNQLARIESPGSGSGQYKRLTEIKYDTNRRKKELKDADAGITSYTYFANGNVKTQTNANSKVTLYTYDKLNRTKTETRDGIVYTYNYDADLNSIGLLSGVTSNSAKADAESYIYDPNGLGRVIEKTRSNSQKTLTHKYEYDTKGRINKLTYPGNFAILYEYNSYDDLLNIKNAANNAIIWKLDEVNALGQKTKATYGNGKQTTFDYDPYHRLKLISVPQVIVFDYVFNDKQQLNYRTEKYWNGSTMVGFKENFTFDNLNRLETASRNGVEKMSMVYNINGSNSQIWSKTGVGSDFQYDYGGANFINSKLSQFTAENSYTPHEHEITYTNRLKVETITDHMPNSPTLTRNMQIEYGIDNERFIQTYTDESGNVTKTWYTSQYEEIISPSTTNRQLSYIFAGDELVAINVAGNDGTPIGLHYVYTDYLGSLRCITNSSGTVEHKLSFDAWGNRRNPETGELLTTIPIGLFTARGFTGHEHLDAFGLINMNGRVYDPATSMFLSPDPYIQAPDFTQNFNRYSYCLNNPLMFTDPSGEFIFSLFLGPLGAVLDNAFWGGSLGGLGYVASVAFSDGGFKNWNGGAFWKSVGVGAISGVITAGIGDAFGGLGGGTTGLGNQIAHEFGRAFTHGVAQGMLAGATGGNMLQSFASGSLGSFGGSAFQGVAGKFASSMVGTVGFSAMAGGIGAELSGGDFWRGAATGATIGLLNHSGRQLQRDIHSSIIKKFVNRMFPNRLSSNAKVSFQLYNGGDGETEGVFSDPGNYPIKVSIPSKFWFSSDKRLLIDCIDHELVHIDDFVSNRAFKYYYAYDKNIELVKSIMEYKAFSENQWYNTHLRTTDDRIDYSVRVEYYKKLLPNGWWNIKGL